MENRQTNFVDIHNSVLEMREMQSVKYQHLDQTRGIDFGVLRQIQCSIFIDKRSING